MFTHNKCFLYNANANNISAKLKHIFLKINEIYKEVIIEEKPYEKNAKLTIQRAPDLQSINKA